MKLLEPKRLYDNNSRNPTFPGQDVHSSACWETTRLAQQKMGEKKTVPATAATPPFERNLNLPLPRTKRPIFCFRFAVVFAAIFPLPFGWHTYVEG